MIINAHARCAQSMILKGKYYELFRFKNELQNQTQTINMKIKKKVETSKV